MTERGARDQSGEAAEDLEANSYILPYGLRYMTQVAAMQEGAEHEHSKDKSQSAVSLTSARVLRREVENLRKPSHSKERTMACGMKAEQTSVHVSESGIGVSITIIVCRKNLEMTQ
jgi:hypothetical protein